MPQLTTTVKKQTIAGELRLQGNDKSNVFHFEEVFLGDENVRFPDFTGSSAFGGQPAFNPGLAEEYTLELSGDNTVLQGYYQDKLGASLEEDTPYEVLIYLWYVTREDNP